MESRSNGRVFNANEKIILSPDLFVDRGHHKECFRYPGNPDLCIKVPYNREGNIDLSREIEYLKILSRKNLDYSVLPSYYGPIKTNRGEGHVFEFIMNYDGSSCITVEEILKDEALMEKYFDFLVKNLKQLHHNLLDNQIITMGLFPHNLIVQYTAPDKARLRLLNDLGCGTFIRLSYYFDFVAIRQIEKRWQRFAQFFINEHYDGRFTSPLVPELANRIRQM